MAFEKERNFETALLSVLNDLDLQLKQPQQKALKAFLLGNDVSAVLPTGYGKSLIYQLAPLVAKKMDTNTNPVVVVVSPLVALMEQQVNEASTFGVTGMQLGVNSEEEIISASPMLLFGSPESWIMNEKWRNFLSTTQDLLGIVVDEVHLMYKWGQGKKGTPAFRECFSRLAELRSLVKTGTPILTLTASADLEARARVEKLLLLDSPTLVNESPNRTNIRIGIRPNSVSLDCLDWIVREVREKGLTMSQIIIYVRTLKDLGTLFCYLKAELGEDAWVDGDTEQRPENMLIGMFHSKTLQENKSRVIDSFAGKGNCRVVVATTALGMGLNFPKISHVVLYGLPEDVESLVQEVGRAGRDGTQSHAVINCVKQYTPVDEKVKLLVKSSTMSCIRKLLFRHFENQPLSVIPGHLCCTYCHSMCHCHPGGCKELRPDYESVSQNVQQPKCREVSDDDKARVARLLIEYKNSLISCSTHLYTSKAACTGFSEELVQEVLKHSQNIFDANYILTHLPVFSSEHVNNILIIMHQVFEDIDNCPITMSPPSVSMPDQNFTGYYDTESEESSSFCSQESGFSPLEYSD